MLDKSGTECDVQCYDNINKGIVTKPSHTCTSQNLPQYSSAVPAGMMKAAYT